MIMCRGGFEGGEFVLILDDGVEKFKFGLCVNVCVTTLIIMITKTENIIEEVKTSCSFSIKNYTLTLCRPKILKPLGVALQITLPDALPDLL